MAERVQVHGALKRSIKGFRDDNLTDWAAALTYYGVLSIFPALIAIVSITGLIGSSAIDPLIENVGEIAPGPGREIAEDALNNLRGRQGTAGLALIVSLAIAIWSASAYVAAFMRASNTIYAVEEERPVWKTLSARVAVTLVLLALLIVTAIGVTATGGIAEQIAEPLGLDDTAVTVWEIAKWPFVLLAVSFILSLLYRAAPDVERRGSRWLTPGAVVALLLWLLASLAFAAYVAGFASYNKTYGTMAAPIVFLVWLWISNVAVLFGAELNAQLER